MCIAAQSNISIQYCSIEVRVVLSIMGTLLLVVDTIKLDQITEAFNYVTLIMTKLKLTFRPSLSVLVEFAKL